MPDLATLAADVAFLKARLAALDSATPLTDWDPPLLEALARRTRDIDRDAAHTLRPWHIWDGNGWHSLDALPTVLQSRVIVIARSLLGDEPEERPGFRCPRISLDREGEVWRLEARPAERGPKGGANNYAITLTVPTDDLPAAIERCRTILDLTADLIGLRLLDEDAGVKHG